MSVKPCIDDRIFDGLNPRQSRFVTNVWGGKPAVRAYADAYDKDLGKVDSRPYNVAKAAANRLLTKVNVKRVMEEFRSSEVRTSVLTRDEKREILGEIARGDGKAIDRIRAIHTDNLMMDDYNPRMACREHTPIEEMMKNLRLHDSIEAPEDS